MDFKEKWIQNKIDSECLRFLDDFGWQLCDKKSKTDTRESPGHHAVTSSQLRNIFSEVKRIETKLESAKDDDNSWYDEFLLLNYKIAYNTARTIQRERNNQNHKIKLFREVIDKAYYAVKPNEKEHFRNFTKFFEGIIAFHKVYGGKDGN